ncbi:hypothetical protein BT96DRAFT_917053 [Gymnopus androsaceus JB14]|uniref:Protein kinase domain-containing protein n=1 Tax=Gymnopus androsaceus JB14 TaxID=1447944 RepID=A0A6A4I193_9AGAR|nr:hypothetical protein BT96DRAFT_917053 [Gymnopus androsaceus JB14]
MASPKLFENASQFSIQESEFNAVAGDLIMNNTNNYNYFGDAPSSQMISGRWFRVIPDGDVFVLSTSSSAIKASQGLVKVVRSISTVQVVGLGESNKFTVVAYEGPHSQQAFEDDLVQHSRLRHPNLIQLFGLIHGCSVPAMIFHSELIPLRHFAEQCSSSPFALVYLKYRYTIDSLKAKEAVTGSIYSIEWRVVDEQFWIQPSSGLICAGPFAPLSNYIGVQRSHRYYDQLNHLENIPQLKVAFYKSDNEIIRHIEDHFESVVSFVESQLGTYSGNLTCEECSGHLFTVGSVISTSEIVYPLRPGRIIAQVDTYKVPYSIGRWNINSEPGELHSTGWTRFLPYSQSLCSVDMEIQTQMSAHDLQVAWVVQAAHILENIDQKYTLFSSRINMSLRSTQQVLSKHPLWIRLPFLFIAPVKITEIESIPYFSFHNEPYFWSFDLNGIQKISHTTQMLLGLPSFVPGVFGGMHWSTSEHTAVSQYLRSKGFSSGLKYSCKQGYPLFKVPKSNVQVESEEFEIIEAVSDVTDNADVLVEEDWAFISDNQSCHSSDDFEQHFSMIGCTQNHKLFNKKLRRTRSLSSFNLNRDIHDLIENSDCSQNHKLVNQKLRRTRSLSSFNPSGGIYEPIENRLLNLHSIFWCQYCFDSRWVHPAVRKPCTHREHHIRLAMEMNGCIPWEHMDFCLDLIDY